MEKSRLAKQRNWQKSRLLGITFDMSVLTDSEIQLMSNINSLRQQLIQNWEENSKSLGLKIKRYDLYIREQLRFSNVPINTVRFYTRGLEKHEYNIIKRLV